MASKSAEGKESVTRGTGNVFADLGFPDAAERQARLRLAFALNQELEARKISQADAAKVLGVTQPKVSALGRYKLAGFSVERLMNLLTALDQDVEIVIRRKPVLGRLGGSASSQREASQWHRSLMPPLDGAGHSQPPDDARSLDSGRDLIFSGRLAPLATHSTTERTADLVGESPKS
jgi:predicted XRE-type DNA-binding protein